MDDYKPNSHKSKEDVPRVPEDRKKVEKVVNGVVKSKKKSELRKMAESFMVEDVTTIKNHILLDVIIPHIKKAVWDVLTNSLEMFLYPGGAGAPKKSSNATKMSYTKYYDKPTERRSNNERVAKTNGYSYDDIILDNRGEAEEVLSKMDEIIDTYEMASVADLYELVGITGHYTDNDYGWFDIRAAAVVRVREGYLLKLPRAKPLN